MKKDTSKPTPRPPLILGQSIELARLHIVGLYDPESGAVLHRHSTVIAKGGEDVSEDEAIKETFARAKAFHARIESDAVEMKKMAARGQSLFPINKLKVAVSNNPEHLEMQLRVDPKSGKFVELLDGERPKRRESGRA